MLNSGTLEFSGEGNRASRRVESLRTVAVIDIGKTNAKVALVDAETGAELVLRTAANTIRADGPYPHFDVPRLWDFSLGAMAEIRREHEIGAIVVVTHGAAGALVSGDPDEAEGLALPVLDYEAPGPDETRGEYDPLRPPFSETLSPRMTGGLNLGAQMFWQQRCFPDAFRGARYLTYPQYWTWRLTGVLATEVTSIGCHTDLWNPAASRFSSMVDRLGWRDLFPPLRPASDHLGPVQPDLARRLGLSTGTPALCGIHDSNASLLPHLLRRDPPFSVVSTGTWVIVLAVGGGTDRLDPGRDGLAYVNAFGDPVPAGRFMGGREYDRLTGGRTADPNLAEIDRVLAERIMALPSFTPESGPFPRGKGRWTRDPETLSAGERCAAAAFYLALMTSECLEIAGARGPAIIEGPFTGNRLFCAGLAAVSDKPVFRSGERTGTTLGAALLAMGKAVGQPAPPDPVASLQHPELIGYAKDWRKAAAQA